MAEIPFDKDYLRKHYPDKYKELEKNKTPSSTSQSKNEDIKHHNEVEKDSQELIDGVLKHPALKFFTDKIDYVLNGNIERPVFPKNATTGVVVVKNCDEAVKIKSEWIVIACEYIAKHLNRWASEKVEGEIEDWYKTITNPFTKRISVIVPFCEDLKKELPLCLPKYYDAFCVKYDDLRTVAEKADKEQAVRLGTWINNFKLSAGYLFEIVSLILSEAENILSGKTEETGGNATPAKWWGITTFKNIIEKGWQIFTKSFWDSVFERWWPK